MKINKKLSLFSKVTMSLLLLTSSFTLNKNKNEVPVNAEYTGYMPVLIGPSIGDDVYSPTYRFRESAPDSDILTLTATLEAGYYMIAVAEVSEIAPWDPGIFRYIAPLTSNAYPYLYPYQNGDFGLIYSGTVTFNIYNPTRDNNSLAGEYRLEVNYEESDFPLGGNTAFVLVGDALDGWDDPAFSNANNRLNTTGLEVFEGRYFGLTRYFNAGEFEVYFYQTHFQRFTMYMFDQGASTAGDVISEGTTHGISEFEANAFKVNEAGEYTFLFDIKTYQITFHHAPLTYNVVSKYDGEDIIEKEIAVSTLPFTPTPAHLPYKKMSMIGI